MWNEIADCVPDSYPHQVTAEWMVERHLANVPPAATVVDLGCGAGNSVDLFRRLLPQASWTGVDIEGSPEVQSRLRTDATFVTFDGVAIPFPDGAIDLVYSKQVFEHVRHPEDLLRDVRRALKAGGLLIGSTSHLEPYHSFQLWNFTPYGFRRILADAGLDLIEIRPGIDGRTLVERTHAGRPKSYSRFFASTSPLNEEIDHWGMSEGKSVRQILVRKLSVCGQFAFVAVRRRSLH